MEVTHVQIHVQGWTPNGRLCFEDKTVMPISEWPHVSIQNLASEASLPVASAYVPRVSIFITWLSN